MRVLQLGPLYNNHLRRWSANAVALGCTVYAAGHVRPARRPVDLAGVAVEVDVLPDELLDLGTKRQLHWLRGVIERIGPDLVQAHSLPRWGYLAATSGIRPLAVTPWGSDFYLAAGADRERADRALIEADAVLARSPHMRRELIGRGVSADRIHEVDLGVDLGRFRPAPACERSRLKAELGMPPGPTVLSFRAGTQLYNLDVVLDAFRILRGRIADAALVLVHGDAPLARTARAALRGLDPASGSMSSDTFPTPRCRGICWPRTPVSRFRAQTARPAPSGRRSPAGFPWSCRTCPRSRSGWAEARR